MKTTAHYWTVYVDDKIAGHYVTEREASDSIAELHSIGVSFLDKVYAMPHGDALHDGSGSRARLIDTHAEEFAALGELEHGEPISDENYEPACEKCGGDGDSRYCWNCDRHGRFL